MLILAIKLKIEAP